MLEKSHVVPHKQRPFPMEVAHDAQVLKVGMRHECDLRFYTEATNFFRAQCRYLHQLLNVGVVRDVSVRNEDNASRKDHCNHSRQVADTLVPADYLPHQHQVTLELSKSATQHRIGFT